MNRALAFVVLLAAGCGNTVTMGGNDQGVTQACTPGAKECVSDNLARVCPSDGMGWLGVPCASGTKCSMGACVTDTSMCKPGTGSCVGTSAMRCMDNGMGFLTTTCPANTQCVNGGVCKGTCVVGSSTCTDPSTVANCTDGVSTTPAGCSGGQLCVDTTTDPNFPTAACKPAACTPQPGVCNTVCGNKNDASANQALFTSTCVATPSGYQWQANKCLAPKTCSPTGAACGTGYGAACSTQCNPGDVRCTSDGNGTQTCKTDGTWAAGVGCDASQGQRCVNNASGAQSACGDPVCDAAPGTCDPSGNFHACVGGKLSVSGAPCAMGICARTSNPNQTQLFGGQIPGACLSECTAGDRRCIVGGTNFETCANGLWGMPSGSCGGEAGANNCFNTTNAQGRPDVICGVCLPGTHQCASTDAGADRGIQTCDLTGQWGATTSCTLGACQSFFNQLSRGVDASCVASCIPGTKMCTGGWFNEPGTNFYWQNQVADCNPDGTPGSFTGCPGNQGCRRDVGGNVLGCVECVGSTKNEFGFVDTACGNPAGVPGGNQTLVTCKGDNTWGTFQSCGSVSCQRATGNSFNSINFQAPPVDGIYCHRCYTGSGQTTCTESNMLAGYHLTCAQQNRGIPVACKSPIAGQPDILDCCGNSCFADTPPAPAYCGPSVPNNGVGCGCGCGSGI